MRKRIPITVEIIEAEPLSPEALQEWVRLYLQSILRLEGIDEPRATDF